MDGALVKGSREHDVVMKDRGTDLFREVDLRYISESEATFELLKDHFEVRMTH